MNVRSARGKMLNHLRRDCWGCDNAITGRRHACECRPSKSGRQREERQWREDLYDEARAAFAAGDKDTIVRLLGQSCDACPMPFGRHLPDCPNN